MRRPPSSERSLPTSAARDASEAAFRSGLTPIGRKDMRLCEARAAARWGDCST